MKKVLVYMNTYNSGEYLQPQIESILNQKNVITYIAIRDDCSKDKTPQILKNITTAYPGRVMVLYGNKNIGVEGSTRANLEHWDRNGYDYYAFADHDDVWLDDKLSSATNMLRKLDSSQPALYYSNLAVTDQYLNYEFDAYGKGRILATPESCFVDFAASANTFVMNRLMMEAYIANPAKDFYFGDVWLQFMAFFIGNVVYDDVPHILFRRTGNNVSGPRDTGIRLWINRLKKIKKESGSNNLHMHSDMAKYLLDLFGDRLSDDKKEVLRLIAYYNESIGNRLKLLFSKKIRSKSKARNITFHGRLILNLL